MKNKELFIIGSGGLGRELLAMFKNINFLDQYSFVGFIDNKNQNKSVKGIEIAGNSEYLSNYSKNCDVVIAIGNIYHRRTLLEELQKNKYINFITFVHPRTIIYDPESVKIGKGCIIAEGSIITSDVFIDDFCFINIGVSIHHDTVIGKNCVLMPGVRITGGANVIGETYIGSNYQISDKVQIAKNSILKLKDK
ncbi:hypothetical protein H0I25_14300 [Cellulophaga sp. HaHa_2_95]|uniref:PglD-related sugar-binding protein n=1 Tax=Cellulophaga TaxID=104264 RepID=UPI001C4E7588|nr:hypothetical protein [Cellulophaga sp. HaHa_2_95]QXP55240.1 hypothetical protein H0I25_14300 [Cellulophaga sp. HaHa_2_95]